MSVTLIPNPLALDFSNESTTTSISTTPPTTKHTSIKSTYFKIHFDNKENVNPLTMTRTSPTHAPIPGTLSTKRHALSDITPAKPAETSKDTLFGMGKKLKALKIADIENGPTTKKSTTRTRNNTKNIFFDENAASSKKTMSKASKKLNKHKRAFGTQRRSALSSCR